MGRVQEWEDPHEDPILPSSSLTIPSFSWTSASKKTGAGPRRPIAEQEA